MNHTSYYRTQALADGMVTCLLMYVTCIYDENSQLCWHHFMLKLATTRIANYYIPSLDVIANTLSGEVNQMPVI